MDIILDVSEFQSLQQLDWLLRNAEDNVVAVYIKGTQGLSYRDSLAQAFAECCQSHNTAFGYYDYLTNDQAVDQEAYFAAFLAKQPKPGVITMLDAEGAYNKYAAGEEHWQEAYGGRIIGYSSLSDMPKYASLTIPKWVAQYDSMNYTRPEQREIDDYKADGYAAWQFTDNYMRLNQDASILLADFSVIKA